MKGKLVWLVTAILLAVVIFAGTDTHWYNRALKNLPVQDAGRLKPYDTFARETLELTYGKQKFEGKPAGEIVLTWLLQPDAWSEKEFIEIRHHLVKRTLKLDEGKRYFSPKEVLSSEHLTLMFQELQARREAKEKLDPYGQAVQRLENQLVVFREIAAGRAMRLAPKSQAASADPSAAGADAWLSVAEMEEPLRTAFMEMTKSFIMKLGAADAWKDPELTAAVENFREAARSQNPEVYPAHSLMQIEVVNSEYHPFRHAYMAYLFAALFLALLWILHRPEFIRQGWLFSWVGLFFHTAGFLVRIYLTGRPPVSNMYETVVWVGFGAVVFAMVIEKIYRWNFILAAGAAVGAFCLIVADAAPTVLDPALQPLEPVLRSNFWLTTHVLTITISYAAFFLAFALGDIGLFFFFKDEHKYKDRINALVLAIYRSIQIGIALLAPGIILGGIWADYSWGRFWGWDPKETWALIALLGYLAVLHGRLVGWVKGFGMVVSAIVTFSLVIMAWYGVNFVLGAGLHSYGFGAGGVEYVASFVVLHLLAVIYVALVRHFKKQSSSTGS